MPWGGRVEGALRARLSKIDAHGPVGSFCQLCASMTLACAKRSGRIWPIWGTRNPDLLWCAPSTRPGDLLRFVHIFNEAHLWNTYKPLFSPRMCSTNRRCCSGDLLRFVRRRGSWLLLPRPMESTKIYCLTFNKIFWKLLLVWES